MSNGKSIFGAFILAAAVFTVWPGIFGSYNSAQALRAAKTEREALLAERTQILENVTSEYTKYSQATAGAAGTNFAALVPVGRDSAELLSALDDMATGAGVTLSQISVSDSLKAQEQSYKAMTINAELKGSYSGLRTFLTSLEQYVRILNVQSLKVTRDAQTGGLGFTLFAEAYFVSKK